MFERAKRHGRTSLFGTGRPVPLCREAKWPRPNIRVTSRHLVGVLVCSKRGRGRSGKIWMSRIFPACRFAIHRLRMTDYVTNSELGQPYLALSRNPWCDL